MTGTVEGDGVNLVVGAGQIGAALAARLRWRGEPVVTTSRTGRGGDLTVDLAAPPERWQLPERITVAYLCAGITSQETCRTDPDFAWGINVRATSLLVERLVGAGAFVVYPSTNLVFDGTIAHRPAGDPPNPLTTYGRTKAAAEATLARFPDSTAIVRLTKVVAPAAGLLASWASRLRCATPVEAFSDLVFSPIPLATAIDAILLAGDRRLIGITQVSGSRDISYAAAARWIAGALNAPADLVRAVTTRDAGFEHVPLHTTLDDTRLREAWDRWAPDPEAVLRLALPG
ncbi:MAG: sugar nucleotide-binding protein [Planctomycetes bacterium]|nr:sugar nucleotide-binding protein [Planctomycetota bacterium]